MTLQRWHELEYGVDGGAVERDETTGIRAWYSSYKGLQRSAFPDRETGALKRLKTLMSGYPKLRAYVHSDPRGAALYILRDDDAYYSRGLPVFK